jgi:hypothetical protein
MRCLTIRPAAVAVTMATSDRIADAGGGQA